jgi:aliphatic nitrilase
MDREATIAKACRLIDEAARNGAQLVAFPEAYVPGYPYWARYLPPLESLRYTKELAKQAVLVPSAAVERLADAARDARMHVVIGMTERIAHAQGTLFNTNLIVGPDGRLLGRHRKLVPTLAEKLVWAYGDGAGLRVRETALGRIGTLICGENANPLARFTLIAEGEQVHVANYFCLPRKDSGGYNLGKEIEIRSAAHSFEGKLYTVASSMVIDDTVVRYFSGRSELQALLSSGSVGHTAVYGPSGLPVAGPLEQNVEGIVYADIDLDDILLPKLRHDVAGGYNRFDIMSVRLNRAPHSGVQDVAGAADAGGTATSAEAQRLGETPKNQPGRNDGDAARQTLEASRESYAAMTARRGR